MKLFEDTTIWTKIELSFSSDEQFIENFEKIFDYFDSEYHPKAEMKFYLDIKEETVWIEISRDDGMDETFKLTIDNQEIDFEEDTAESILKAIKQNIFN